jgi:hypothetical protein
MVNEHTLGRIVDIDESGVATIKAPLPNLLHALDRHYDDVEIILPDGRRITPKQRRLCYLLLGGIAEYVDGIRNEETIEDAKQMMKMEFMLNRMKSQERRLFSLSNCDETTATCFITYLIDFIVKNDIPTSFSLLDNCEDIGKYIYACLANKKCCICGKHADLHHVDAVGSGNNRNEIHHLGRLALPLCREHHIASHKAGQQSFMAKYHLEPIALDEKLCKIYGLKK